MPDNLLEAITHQAKAWFEKRKMRVTAATSSITGRHYWDIYNDISKASFVFYVGYFPDSGQFAISLEACINHYELADPEFPENMFQDIEKITREDMWATNYRRY